MKTEYKPVFGEFNGMSYETQQNETSERIKQIKKQNRKLTTIIVFIILLAIPSIISMFLFSTIATAFISAIAGL